MPDLLTHVLSAYVLATTLSFRYEWLTSQYVTIVMLGAMLPDLTKASLLISDAQIEALLGIPFSWFALHTVGGILVTTSVGALLVGARHRHRVFLLLLSDAASHLILDALLLKPSGYASALFWPLTTYGLPTPGIYHSTDRWLALITGLLAGILWYTKPQPGQTGRV